MTAAGTDRSAHFDAVVAGSGCSVAAYRVGCTNSVARRIRSIAGRSNKCTPRGDTIAGDERKALYGEAFVALAHAGNRVRCTNPVLFPNRGICSAIVFVHPTPPA